MNEPFVKCKLMSVMTLGRKIWIKFIQVGLFSWIDNRRFQFDQHSTMWCRPNNDGIVDDLLFI